MKFHICPIDNSCEQKLYTHSEFEINPGVTVLVGCNGAGKTTLLQRINDALKKDGAPVLLHEQKQAKNKLSSRLAFNPTVEMFAAVVNPNYRSEGEGNIENFTNLLPEMGRFVIKNPSDHNERWLLLDGLESGLSIDVADEICELIQTIEESAPENITLYLIISTNSFELAKDRDCIDVQTAKHRTFKTYASYATYIRNSRKKKNNRKDISERMWETKYKNDTSYIIRD